MTFFSCSITHICIYLPRVLVVVRFHKFGTWMCSSNDPLLRFQRLVVMIWSPDLDSILSYI